MTTSEDSSGSETFLEPEGIFACFYRHPDLVGQTYYEHLCDSWSFSWICFKSGIAFVIHGLFPWMFEFTGSNNVIGLGKSLEEKRKNIFD